MNAKSNEAGRYKKAFQDLEFTDDFMFRKVMYNNEELCKNIIELLLDVDIDHIVYKDQEHSITATTDSKSVRLDVYIKGEDGSVFDLEMQNLRFVPLPKRIRYYQSMIDVDNLASGAEYDELPDSYIVFICTFDPFEKGLHKYEFREICLQDRELELCTGTSKVFINAKSSREAIDGEMKAFLDYLCGAGAESELTKAIEAGVADVKRYKPWEAEYMQLYDMISLAKRDGQIIGRAVGRKQGRQEARLDDVKKLVAEGILDAESACRVLGVDYAAYREYLSEINT